MVQTTSLQGSRIQFHTYGEGNSVLVAFHGYGEDGSVFAPLAAQLGNIYTIICPDLPFHGGTNWEKEDHTEEDLYALLNTIVPLSARKVMLMGYSMGGRLALAFAQRYPGNIEKLILIATDGLHNNFWYWLSTQTKWGNDLFRITMRRPQWIFTLMNSMSALHLLNKSVYRFAHYYLDDEQQRTDLYKRWTGFRKIRPSVQALQKEKRYKTLLLFGRYDRIISAEKGKALAEHNECIEVKMIQGGHQLLAEKHAGAIARHILK